MKKTRIINYPCWINVRLTSPERSKLDAITKEKNITKSAFKWSSRSRTIPLVPAGSGPALRDPRFDTGYQVTRRRIRPVPGRG